MNAIEASRDSGADSIAYRNISYGLGAALLLGGTALFLVQEEADPSLAVRPGPGPAWAGPFRF